MTEETFDEIADRYDEAFPAHVVQHYLDKRVAYLRDRCGAGRALDVGCGTGVLAGRLSDVGFQITGLDPSQGMLQVMGSSHPGVPRVRGDGASLPVRTGGFDVSLTVAALHHVASVDAVRRTLVEMVRVVRIGGHVVVWDHNPRNPYWKILMEKVPQDDGSERLVPEDEIVDGLRAGGAEIVGRDQLGLVPDFVPRSLLRATQLTEKVVERAPGLRRLCAHNVILAQRR
ncbi:MAG: methyltransferase domain-containing protein [Acidimicrobiales bacterium]